MTKIMRQYMTIVLAGVLLITSFAGNFAPSASAASTKAGSSKTKAILPPGVTLVEGNYKEPVLDPPKITKFDENSVSSDVYALSSLSKGKAGIQSFSSSEKSINDPLREESLLPAPFVPKFLLTSKEVGALMEAGAGQYDRYQLHLLRSQQVIDPLQVWDQKKKSGLLWSQWLPTSGLKIANSKSVSQDVYGFFLSNTVPAWTPLSTKIVTKDTVQQDTYQPSMAPSMSIMSVTPDQENSVNSAKKNLDNYLSLINPKKMNEIYKEQYSDRQKTSESVDPASGALTWKFNALSYPGRDGLDMNLGLMYQSNQASSFLQANALIPTIHYVNNEPGYFLSNLARTEWATTNYLVDRFRIGNGWSFQIPSVQVENPKYGGPTQYYYQNGQGSSMQVKFDGTTDLEKATNLINPPNKLTRFMKDGGSFSNGQTTSAFYMEYPDKKREYFDANGRLIGIVDRFQNKLTYEYGGGESSNIPLDYMQITDTTGRKLRVEYQRAETENTITVYSITSDGNRQAEMVLKNQPQTSKARDKGDSLKEKNEYIQDVNPILRTISYVNDNSNGERQYLWTTKFNYQQTFAQFSYGARTWQTDSGIGVNAVFPLTEIEYPRSQTYYQYGQIAHALGKDGITQDYIVTHRADERQRKDGLKNNIELNKKVLENNDLTNVVRYEYENEYTGLSQNADPENLPSGYTYGQTAFQLSQGNQTFRTVTRFNNKAQRQDLLQYGTDGHSSMTAYEAYDGTFKFNPTRTKTDTIDNSGRVTHYTENNYDELGNLRQTTAPLTDGQLADANTKQKRSTFYTYDPQYNQIATESKYQNENKQVTTTYHYTSEGRPSSVIDANNQETTYSYSKAGNAVSQMTVEHPVKPGVRARTVTEYGAESGYTLPAKVSTYFRSASGGNELQNTKSFTYDPRTSLVKQETDGEGKTTRYAYDLLDRITSVTKPSVTNTDGESYTIVDEYSYNNAFVDRQDGSPVVAGLVVVTDQQTTQKSNGKKAILGEQVSTYDGFGMTLTESYMNISSADTTMKMTRYTTDAQMRPTKQTSAVYRPVTNSASLQLVNGPVDELTVAYDSWNQAIETKDAKGNVVKVQHQPAFYRQSLTFVNAGGNVLNAVDQQYDQWGNLIETVAYKDAASHGNPLKETYTYDIAGNVLTYTDPEANANGQKNRNNEGATQSFRYDGLNRLTSLKDALNQTTSYEYDGNDQLIKASMQDAGGTNNAVIYSKDFNESKMLLSKTDPANASTQNQYDALGRLKSSTDRNGSGTSYTYDEQDQVKEYTKTMTSPKAQTVKYVSTFGKGDIQTNQASLQTTGLPVVNQQVKTDLLGRVIQQRGYTSSNDYIGAMNLTYNGWGQVASMQTDFQAGTTPVKGTRQNYSYDTKEQLTTINLANGSKNIQYTYTPQGQVDTVTYPTMTNGKVLKSSYTYNALNQMETMTTTLDNDVVAASNYQYDGNGNIVQAIEKRQGKADDTITYGYDALNRLISVNQPSRGQASYTYDLRGNRLTLEETRNTKENLSETSYSYNALNQLDQWKSDGKTLDFRYLPDGTRYQKQLTETDSKGTVTKTVQKSVSNSAGKVIFEAKGSEQSEYIRGDRVLLKKKPDSNTLYYYLYNGHGDVIGILYDNGTVANSYEYDEFGNTVAEQEKTSNPFKYAGEYQDSESGLYYLNARYYDPSMGRFLNEDTVEGQITNPLTMNNYTYVENNPTNYIDPTGNSSMQPRSKKSTAGGNGPGGPANGLPKGGGGGGGGIVGGVLLAAIKKVESSIRHEKIEYGQFFDQAGNKVKGLIKGTETSIDLSPYKDIAKDKIFTHNHPTNGYFSWQDLETAVDFEMGEIRAVLPNGMTISMKRVGEKWGVDSNIVKKIYEDAQIEVRNDPDAQNYKNSGKYEKVFDMLFSRIASKIGGQYYGNK
ncbi:RHS repeat-associated protein [Paenibacillus sp. SORGH_AS306]|uniref:RHS repeat domain-containing protein n=1 Tax=Paenibacillus sp. SORGH_AS_0306 TaxID=3041754 RepID=UPI0027894B0E|nr:RHS repeat-associated core domain-containing protein [Paenibacillus sp. SORGH_AS_0306]MDQ1236739.1 RHS repeat-associated protein [Paenibacillus sp. SORGH_AS_0306]